MNRATITVLGFGVLLFSVGCSEFVPSTHDVTLTNKTDNTLVYKAFNTVNAHVNPQPFKVDQEADNLIGPGEKVSLESEIGVLASHEELRVFVWKVERDSAFISQSLTYSADRLEQKNYAIDVETFNSTCTDSSANQQPGKAQGALFTYVSNPTLSEEEAQYYTSIWNRLYTAEVATVRLADNIKSLLEEKQPIRLELPQGQSFTLMPERVTHNESGSISWSGEIQNNLGSSVTLVYGDHSITGGIRFGVDPACRPLFYKLSSISNNLSALYRLNTDTGIYLED